MKKAFRLLAFMTIVMILSSSFTFAVPTVTSQNSFEKQSGAMQELISQVKKATSDGTCTEQEELNILATTKPGTLKEYSNLVFAEAIETIENREFSLSENEVAMKEIIDLPSGGYVKIEAYDLPEGESIRPLSGKLETTDHVIVRERYKKYNNRYFTAKYTSGFLRGWIQLIVVHKYKIGDYGLKVRASECKADYTFESAISGFDIQYCKKEISDPTATKNGEDINVLGHLRFDLTGIGSKGPLNKILDTRVKLVKLDKKNKRAKVQEHFYVKKDFL